MSTKSAYDWLEILDLNYLTLDEKPQFGSEEFFPLQKLQERLRHLLQREDLEIEIVEKGWQPSAKLYEGIGERILPLTLFFAPLKSPLYFVTSEQDLALFMNELLLSKEAALPFANPSYIQGFYQFLGLEVIAICEKLEFAKGLSLRLGENPPSIHVATEGQDIFCIDVTWKLEKQAFQAKLFISKEFRREWKHHFFKNYKPVLAPQKAKEISVEVAVVGGFCQLSSKEWKSARKGDVIILDRALLGVDGHKGKVIFQLHGKPFLRGKLQENGIKLLEYPLYEEVLKSMDEEFENEEEALSDDMDDEDVKFEEFDEEDDEANEEVDEAFQEEEEEPVVEEETKIEVTQKESSDATCAVEKIPLVVSIEVARIKMTLEELMKLSAGNLLDLKIQPEQGVNLVINDKTVGKGELVKVGDVIGVRILQL